MPTDKTDTSHNVGFVSTFSEVFYKKYIWILERAQRIEYRYVITSFFIV